MSNCPAEYEVLSRLKAELREAVSACQKLATLPARGLTYARFRESLKVIETQCRLMARNYREDARWLPIAFALGEAHRRAGGWLRTHPRTMTSNAAHPLFLRLGQNLEALLRKCEALETKATGRSGPVLPKPLPLPHHRPRLVGQVMLPSGLVVPREYDERL